MGEHTSDESSGDTTQWMSVDATAYDVKWERIEASGENAHGEADFVSRYSPSTVLDAGCGSGRVSIELARRGCDVVGVDLDGPFIAAAKTKAPDLDFRLDDLATAKLDRTFDVVVMAGNVMIFVAPGTEHDVVANMAAHLSLGGRLIAGFQLGHSISATTYDALAVECGLVSEARWSSWDGDPWTEASNYAVFVHRKPERT